MKRYFIALLVLFFLPLTASASILGVQQGGTGAGTFTQGNCLIGEGINPFQSTPCSSGGSTFATTSISAIYPILWNTSTAVISTALSSSTLTASSPLTGSFAQVGTGGSLGIQQASGSQGGYLSSTDWTTFNNKLSADPFWVYANSAVSTSSPVLITASTTIGNGTAGLTVSGNSTTTGYLVINGNLDVGGVRNSNIPSALGIISSNASDAYFGAAKGGQVAWLESYNGQGILDTYDYGNSAAIPLRIGNNASYITFGDGGGLSSDEKMRIAANGNVGINTVSPNYKLEVNGSASTTSLYIGSTAGNAAGTFLAVNPSGEVIATNTPSGGGSGTVTSVATDGTLTGGTITTTGTLGLNLASINTWTGKQTFGYASSTAFTASGTIFANNFYDTNTAGSSCIGDSSGILENGNCVSSLASAGGSLTISSPTGNVDASLNLAHANTWSALQTFAGASTTALTATGFFQMPSAANPEPTLKASCSQSTNSPYQIQCGNNAGGTSVYDSRTGISFYISSTTAMTASTTEVVAVPTGFTATSGQCTVQPTGATAEIQWYYANPTAYTSVTSTYWNASSTPGQNAISSNNTPATNATSTMTVGNFTGSPTSVACNVFGPITGI